MLAEDKKRSDIQTGLLSFILADAPPDVLKVVHYSNKDKNYVTQICFASYNKIILLLGALQLIIGSLLVK